MKRTVTALLLLLPLVVIVFVACGGEQTVDIKAVTSQPKAFVGSDTCKMCHLEHYDSWKMTMHSRMLQDAKKNEDAIIVPIDEKASAKIWPSLRDKLKVPSGGQDLRSQDGRDPLHHRQPVETALSREKGRHFVSFLRSNTTPKPTAGSITTKPTGTSGPGCLNAVAATPPASIWKKNFCRAGRRLRSLPREGLLACGPAQNSCV